MPNAIKYSDSAQTLALKKGNFYIGTGDVGKGPTSTTDYWNGITPPAGGYTIYLNKASGGPSIYTAANDSQLISLSNTIAGQTFATAAAALAWFATQTDKMVFNADYPAIVTNGLVLNLDAGFTPSYPTTGTTWYDLSVNSYNSTLTNGPTYNSSNGGSIVFDGSDDFISAPVGANSSLCVNEITIMGWVYVTSFPNSSQAILAKKTSASSAGDSIFSLRKFSNGSAEFQMSWNGSTLSYFDSSIPSINTWFHMAIVVKNGSPGFQMFLNGNNNNGFSSTYATPNWSDVNTYNWQFGLFETATGRVGNVLFYNRSLTQTEVQKNFNAQKSRYGL
jgi:hypothetical protein